ncbi:SecY-interacting protein [Vibrio sp. SS-MA-C1-2]|uniref:SecY-interacting protein n=1 Tax=Vibrio sp. SS-MA-C1-2 TaxID=2908646 RepID=UPI001F3EDE6F|nr:SecY-interacting protein [Vibrio sp. SS-MA-C1-2]UJF18912.1 SecY-interacting protein [Vibrio sp. SS-MA-C1-2]
MDNLRSTELIALSQQYVELWQQQRETLPYNRDVLGMASPCLVKEDDDGVFWQPVTREISADFSNVERGIELTLHNDIKSFYGGLYSAEIQVQFSSAEHSQQCELIQIWSEDDFIRLQENILGHLVMQRRLKISPTVFIAATDDEFEIISICNQSGEILLETVGTKKRQVLADNLSQFISQLTPVV